MIFNQRFELLDLVRDDGIKSFRALEADTGRPVLVHMFVNAEVLAKVDRLPEAELGRILDRGQHDGAPYLVTDRLPEYPGLREWLEARGSAAAAEINPLATAGAWKAMSAPPSAAAGSKSSLDDQFASLFEPVEPLPAAKTQPQPAARRDEKTEEIPAPPGAFTQLFQTPGAASKPPVPSPPPAAAPAAGATPGDFTQLFQAPGTAPKPTSPPPAPAPSAAGATPGEFTQLFQAPGAGPKPPSQPSPPPPAAGATPGEFTQLFQAPGAGPKPPTQPSPPPPAAGATPGEFTQLFQAPGAAPKPPSQPSPPPPAAGATPGEFTQLFQAPGAAPKPPSQPSPPPSPASSPAPGEFTRMFQSPASRPPSPGTSPPPSEAPPGEFTRLFEAPGAAGPMPRSAAVRQPLTPRGAGSSASSGGSREGEFTRVFGPRDVPVAPPSPPPSSLPLSAGATQSFATQQPGPPPVRVQEGPGEFTRAFSVPAPLPTLGQPSQDSSKPAGQQPFSALPEAPSRLPLILGLVGIGVFVVALILFLVFRSRS